MTGTEHFEGMDRARRARRKLAEWIRRYLPCEITGTVGELGGAAVTYALTDSLAAAAIVATIGAMVGYYAVAYINAVRWSVQSQRHRPWPLRFGVANLLAIRSVVVEFGPAEVIDSGLIRPLAYYSVPLLVGDATVGFVIAKVAADVTFYSCAIVSYERFGALVARRRPKREGSRDEIIATVADS